MAGIVCFGRDPSRAGSRWNTSACLEPSLLTAAFRQMSMTVSRHSSVSASKRCSRRRLARFLMRSEVWAKDAADAGSWAFASAPRPQDHMVKHIRTASWKAKSTVSLSLAVALLVCGASVEKIFPKKLWGWSGLLAVWALASSARSRSCPLASTCSSALRSEMSVVSGASWPVADDGPGSRNMLCSSANEAPIWLQRVSTSGIRTWKMESV